MKKATTTKTTEIRVKLQLCEDLVTQSKAPHPHSPLSLEHKRKLREAWDLINDVTNDLCS